MTTPEELFAKSEFDETREHPEYHEIVRCSDWLKGEVHNGRNVTHVQKPFPGLEFTHFPAEGEFGKQGFLLSVWVLEPQSMTIYYGGGHLPAMDLLK